ncbi:MAG TPA: hypothetical protein VEB63_05045 [Chitinophagaceae bacterium]|nr:hypothetical protein [Chitinophagaceae bacterium]
MRLLLLLFLGIPLAAGAQPAETISVYVGGGHLSSTYRSSTSKGLTASKLDPGHHRCLVLNMGVQWKMGQNWRVGPMASYDHYGTQFRTLEFDVWNFLIRVDRIWKRSDRCSFYSGFAAGVSNWRFEENNKQKERRLQPATQFYLAGANLHLKGISFEGHLGWGVSGLLGLAARFPL